MRQNWENMSEVSRGASVQGISNWQGLGDALSLLGPSEMIGELSPLHCFGIGLLGVLSFLSQLKVTTNVENLP